MYISIPVRGNDEWLDEKCINEIDTCDLIYPFFLEIISLIPLTIDASIAVDRSSIDTSFYYQLRLYNYQTAKSYWSN